MSVHNLLERGRSEPLSNHNWGASLRELLVVTVVLALTLTLAFPEVVFDGKTLQSGANVVGVLGSAPPYGYEGSVPPDNFRVDPGASAWQLEPGLRKVRRTYGNLDLPLWNPNVGTGAPLLANMQLAPLNPLKVPLLVSPSSGMWDLYLLGRFLLGGMVAMLFARLLGMALPGALVVAVGYILSGHFMLYSNNHWLEVYLVLPLVLYGVELVVLHARPSAAALLAAAVAFNLLAGMPEPSFLALSLAGGYAAYRLALFSLGARNVGVALRRGALLSAGFAGGFALAAANLLPFAEYVANSHSIHTAEQQLGLGFDSPRLSISLLVPFFNGDPLDNLEHTGFSGVRNYVGVVLPFLALVGLWHKSLMKRAGWLFLGAALLALTKTYGVPGVNELGRLPFANVTIFVVWIAPVAAFSIALLAGIGVDRIYRGDANTLTLHFAGVVIVGVLTLLLLYNWTTLDDLGSREILWVGLSFALALGVWGLLLFGRWLTGSGYVHAAAIIATGTLIYLILDHWGSPGDKWPIRAALGLGLVFVLWTLLWGGKRLAGRQLAWACLALVAGELLLFAPHGVYRDRHDTFSRPPYVEFLQSRQSGEEWPRVFALDALLFPNSASAYDLHDIRDLDALYPERFIPYLRAFISSGVSDRFVGGPWASVEGSSQVAGNPFFDLTGVKYIVTIPEGGIAKALPNPIIDDALSEAGSSPQIRRTGFSIDGADKPVLFAHPPSDVTVKVAPTLETPILRFSLALDPEIWSGLGDGVTFEVAIGESSGALTVFRRSVDPKSNEADRRWFDETLDLSAYVGQNVTVHFRTLPEADSQFDWSGWGDPRLTAETEPEGGRGQFQLMYDGEVRIYQNAHAFPRAFAVHDVRGAADGDAALALMRQAGFDPARMAVVEGAGPSVLQDNSASAGPGGSEVSITKYRDNRVELSARMDAPGLVLLTDTYYPGWKAFVDGERTQLYEADYLFRGVSVPEGEHQITFVYDPASFKVGVALSLLALVCLLAMTAIDLYGHLARHAAGSVEETSDERPSASRRLV